MAKTEFKKQEKAFDEHSEKIKEKEKLKFKEEKFRIKEKLADLTSYVEEDRKIDFTEIKNELERQIGFYGK